MKKSTMKKLGSMILACLMVVSTFATLSTVAYAESNSYKTKIHETYLELDPEELAALTADPTTYDISVFIEFVSSAEELAALYSNDPVEQREKGKNYHSNKNKRLKEVLELENAYVSNLAPFAEIQYDSIEEYEASWKQIRSIAKSKDVKDIEVSITNLRLDNMSNTVLASTETDSNPYDTLSETASNLNYRLAEVFANVGIEDDEYTGDGIMIGVVEVGLPDSTDHIPEENYFSYFAGSSSDANAPLHARLVTSILGGYYGIAKDATIICAATGDNGFLEAVDYLVDEEYLQLINMSLGVNFYNGNYDNMSAYIDYLSYQYNCLFVIAAGNLGQSPLGPFITPPARSLNAITVGAMNKEFRVSYLSSYMHFMDGMTKPDLVAPGENIVFNSNVYEGIDSGTSYATPIVTGIAARLMEEFPDMDSRSLKAILVQSCDKISNQTAEHDAYAGAGCVNYLNAREIAASGQYSTYTKRSSTAEGAVLGTKTVYIPANSEMHLYFFAQKLGVDTNSLTSIYAESLVSSQYQIGINLESGLTYYSDSHIVIPNSSDEAIPCVILVFFMEDGNASCYEWSSLAYDFIVIPPSS